MEVTATKPTREEPVNFTGRTDEYFKIWIVNTALTVVTLGIYSAWAKVRKLRYFYGKTEIAGGTFDYHAKPVAILIGRIIAVGMLIAYYLSSHIHPMAPLIIILIIFLAVPYLVVRSRIFNLRNTSYRNIRFNFLDAYADSFKAFYGGALVTVFSFGLASPTALYWRNKFAIDNSGFGRTLFRFHGEHSRFYAIVYASIGIALVGGILYALFMGVVGPMVMPAPGSETTLIGEIVFTILTLGIFAVYAVVGVYVQVRLRNYTYSNSTLGNNEFVSTLSVRDMLVLYATNALAIAFSLGLLTPWAQIRMAKYRADNTLVLLADDWEDYVSAKNQGGSALGDEIGEVFDVDVDFGF